MTNTCYKIFMIILLFGLTACSTTGGLTKIATPYENREISTNKPIAINIENHLSFPSKYMNKVDIVIRSEIKKKNSVVPLSVVARTNPKFNQYVLGSISQNRTVNISGKPRAVDFKINRLNENAISEGFRSMVADGKALDDYEFTILIEYHNTSKYKNTPAAFLSAVTVSAIPFVREHTMSVKATYFQNENEIGKFSKKIEYDFTYSWGIDAKDNMHLDYARDLTAGVMENLYNLSITKKSSKGSASEGSPQKSV